LEKDDDGQHGRDVGYTMRASLMHGQIWLIYVLNSIFYIRIYKFIIAITKRARQSNDTSTQASIDCSVPRRSSFGEGVPQRARTESKDSSVEKTVRILQYYPIILIVTWLPLIIMRVFEYASFDIPCWVFAFSLGMTNLQGLGNAVVFFSYDSVRLNWIEIITSAFTIADDAKIRLRDTAMGSSTSTSKSTSGGRSSAASSVYDPSVMQGSKMDDTL